MAIKHFPKTWRINDLLRFMEERYSIFTKRAQGLPRPWTDDEILQRYRFCNVYREDDTVTQWIDRNWRHPHSHDPDLFFAMLVARLFNWPDTLASIGWPVPFDEAYIKQLYATVKQLERRGDKVWTGAYMVSTNGRRAVKVRYVVERVLKPTWSFRDTLRPWDGDTLQSYYDRIVTAEGIGSFMAGQVIADLKYADGCPLSYANDRQTWAVEGPGSRRGLNRVMNRGYKTRFKKDEWREKFGILYREVALRQLRNPTGPRVDAQDLQNCLCEFDKYERARLGQGRPRSRYNGLEERT